MFFLFSYFTLVLHLPWYAIVRIKNNVFSVRFLLIQNCNSLFQSTNYQQKNIEINLELINLINFTFTKRILSIFIFIQAKVNSYNFDVWSLLTLD